MKTFMKIISALVLLVLAAVFLAFYFTAGLPDAAEKFFNAVKNNNMNEAYNLLSTDFKSSTSQKELEQFLISNSLNKYKDASWSSRSVNNNIGKLIGTVTTTDGGNIALSMGFIKAEDGWKIINLNKSAAGIIDKNNARKVPSESELITLTTNTIDLFAQSVLENNMQKLREQSSTLFKKQVSLEKFNSAYQSFFKFKDKLMVLNTMAPQFTQKSIIDKGGILIIKGQYPITPNPLIFRSKYVFEGYGWKLLGLKVDI